MDIQIYNTITLSLASHIAQQLRAQPNAPVVVDINSPGGQLPAALAIYNDLLAHAGPVLISICKVKTPAFRRVDFICSPHADRVAERVSTGHRGQDGLSVWEPHGLQD